MATKKEKREAALAKRERFLAQERQRGLDALERDRAYRKAKEEEDAKRIAEANASLNRALAAAFIRYGSRGFSE